MSEPFVQRKGEIKAYAVEPSKPTDHHLQTDDADLSAANVTEQSQYGLAEVEGKRVLIGVLQFSISGCTPRRERADSKSCSGQGIIIAQSNSLLVSRGQFALETGDEGQCIGIGIKGGYPVPVVCNICIGSGQSLQPDISSPTEEQSTSEKLATGEKTTTSRAKTFSAKLLRANGAPICGARAIAKPAVGNEVEGKTNDRGEVSFVFEADECDIRFPEYDVSYEQPILNLGKSKAENSNRLLRKGSQSSEVMALQLRLNVRLQPSPRLKPDGIFGAKTEDAVKRLQRELGVDMDGIVGPITRQAMAANPNEEAPDELKKFIPKLGTTGDFLSHVQQIWNVSGMNRDDFFSNREIASFNQTTETEKRYMLVEGDPVAVIDFRHFFVAASLSYSEKKILAPIGGTDGKAELAGLGNELSQCVSEVLKSKIDSCFSREDLGSNRLGASFGRIARLDQKETPIPKLFENFISQTKPLPPNRTSQVQLPTRWDQFLESLLAILHGLDDLLIPEAY